MSTSIHPHAQNYDRAELEDINADLEWWQKFEHDGWLVAGFSTRTTCTFSNHHSVDGNGSPVRSQVTVTAEQVRFFRGAFHADGGDCLIG